MSTLQQKFAQEYQDEVPTLFENLSTLLLDLFNQQPDLKDVRILRNSLNEVEISFKLVRNID